MHHEFTLTKFKDTINSSRYVNPEERVIMFTELKQRQVEVFNQRLKSLEKMGNLPSEELTAEKLEILIEEINRINDDAQGIYDEKIQKIVNLQNKIDMESDDLLEITKNKLEYYAAKIEGDLQFLITNDCKSLVETRKLESKALLTKAIKYLEDTDVRANDVCNVIASFWKSLATVFDEQRKKQIEEEKKYELALASRGDQHDETIDNLEDKFAFNVEDLKKTVTIHELEDKLKSSFSILDEISQSNRAYTEDVISLINNHGEMITTAYSVYLLKSGEKFGMLPLDKKPEFYEQIRQAKIKELDEEKQKLADDGKKKQPNKKDEEIKVDLPVLEEWQYGETKWFYTQNIDQIIREMLVTDEDREQELARLQKEEEKRKRDEERKIAEELYKKEEAKNKGKKDPKKPEEVKKIEIPPPDEEEPVEEPFPVDSDGNLCLETAVFITPNLLTNLIYSLRCKSIDYVLAERSHKLTTATRLDKKLKEAAVNELDEKLRFLWPRKGKLEVNEYTKRISEIKNHHKRYDRYLEEFKKKRDANFNEYQSLINETNDMMVKYKQTQDELRLQLPHGTSLAELQGLLRRSKDNELNTFQKGRKIAARLEELNSEHIENLMKNNSDFINGLQLIENGGQYSQAEVDYYRLKTEELDKDLSDTQIKRKDLIETIKKKQDLERADPIKIFEKEYAACIENLSAREGIGKKYRAPKRNAQEKITGEMTKCERAQAGIDNTISDLHRLVEEYKETIAARAEPRFSIRVPSIAIEIRRTLISLRACIQKYGAHISAFKDEANIQPLKSLT